MDADLELAKRQKRSRGRAVIPDASYHLTARSVKFESHATRPRVPEDKHRPSSRSFVLPASLSSCLGSVWPRIGDLAMMFDVMTRVLEHEDAGEWQIQQMSLITLSWQVVDLIPNTTVIAPEAMKRTGKTP